MQGILECVETCVETVHSAVAHTPSLLTNKVVAGLSQHISNLVTNSTQHTNSLLPQVLNQESSTHTRNYSLSQGENTVSTRVSRYTADNLKRTWLQRHQSLHNGAVFPTVPTLEGRRFRGR